MRCRVFRRPLTRVEDFMDFNLRAHTHLLVVAGSRAYGTNRPDSDVDVKGIAIPPARYLHGYLHRFEQADKPEHVAGFVDVLTPAEQDIVRATKLEGTIFELRKFVALAAECNPNILDVLFCRDEEVRFVTPIGKKLRANRHLFLCTGPFLVFGLRHGPAQEDPPSQGAPAQPA